MIVLDKALSESAPLMAVLATELNELGVSYRIGSDCEPGSVQWMRKVSERTVDENARVLTSTKVTFLFLLPSPPSSLIPPLPPSVPIPSLPHLLSSQSLQIISNRVEVEERALLVCLEAQGFAGLVHYWKQASNQFT